MATMEQITVLVVDDSAFMRRAVTDVIERDPRFKVVGTARNGEDALAKIPRLRPQLITMDLEMPGMGGVAAIREIIRQWRLPVVVLSALTQEGATATLDALSAGAVDVFLKQEVLAQVSVRRAGHAADGQGAGDPAVLADFHRRLWMAARANVQGAGTAAAAHGPAPERPAWGVSAPADTAIAPTDTAAAPAGGPAGAGPADAPSAAAHTHSAPAKAPAGR
ncbi:MAG: response regulator, partial [Chloroflexi bacterium]|nr:response regulator [Chloroflexota bacterium]